MTEKDEQAAVIKWCRNLAPLRYSTYCSEIQGAVILPYVTARNETSRRGKWRSSQGNIKGIPDLFFPLVAPQQEGGEWAGLWIELKVEGGTVSPEQDQWLDILNRAGYYADVCYSALDAIELIELYLGGEL